MNDRATFANYACQLFMKQYSSIDDLIANLSKVKKLHDFFEEHVRNIYELEDEIPLFHAYYLKKHGADNFHFTEEEFEEEYNKTIKELTKQYEKCKTN